MSVTFAKTAVVATKYLDSPPYGEYDEERAWKCMTAKGTHVSLQLTVLVWMYEAG